MLDTLAELLSGGRIELQSDRGSVLAVLDMANPAAFPAHGGVLTLRPIANETAARSAGRATSAQVFGGDGSEVFSCDVGDAKSGATIRLQTTDIVQNAVVQITSFELRMS